MNQKLFTKDFTLVVIGQIISLFGNATLRFALPLYLLNQTSSAALYGTVSACAFIPAILLSPIGGIIADRVNKRNIMVTLDFLTAAIILTVYFSMDRMNLILLFLLALMLLYGIAGAYQPSVQASLPALVSQANLTAANATVNSVNSLASLLGPVLGGILYSVYGIKSVLILCVICFTASAIMEIFIHIPFIKQKSEGTIIKIAKHDLMESFHFIYKEKPIIRKVVLEVCGINLFLSAMIIVALPYLITEVLVFTPTLANQLYGYAEGILAAGGLAGGLLAGVCAKKLSAKKSGNLLLLCAVCVFPMGLSLMFGLSDIVSYIIITACCFVMMAASTIFAVQMISFVQSQTPQHLTGKVMAVMLMISMCAQPIGIALYGTLFQILKHYEYIVILAAGIITCVAALNARKVFEKIDQTKNIC